MSIGSSALTTALHEALNYPEHQPTHVDWLYICTVRVCDHSPSLPYAR